MSEPQELDTTYDPRAVEPGIYERWEKSGAFCSRPDGRPREQCYAVVIPPPNVTGALHLGHALNNTLQDILIRYHRMRGFNTLWQPGTDHAGIATQAVVERRIRQQEGKTRHELGREELVKRIWQWKDEYEARILSQLKLMGCSCDWERNRFTLDEGLARAVRHMFFKLFKDGLIFRGKRLVNWDTQLQTAVADDEVYHETVKGHFWYFKYPVIDPKPDEPEYAIIATTRPETMLGDTAVAIHPDPEGFFDRQGTALRAERENASARERGEIDAKLDALARTRESHLARLIGLRDMAIDGRKLMLPLVERRIPLICDEWADPTKGTGCVKITPAHDPNDYEVGLRHALPMVNVLTPDGKVARIIEPDGSVNPHSADYEGLTFSDHGRTKVVADLEARGLLHAIEDHQHELGHSDRSKLPIEPYLSDQWFLRTGDIEPEPQASACANSRTSTTAQRSSHRRTVPDLAAGATLLTWATYGTWLPGDDRGSVSRAPRANGTQSLRNIPGEPYDGDDARRRAGATERAKGDAVRLQSNHAAALLESIAGTSERHGIELLAVAIMPNHVHVLCQGEQHGAELLQLFKGNASRHLNDRFTLPGAPRWWTKSGSRRRIKPGADLAPAIQYVKDQQQPLSVWSYEILDGLAAKIIRGVRGPAGEDRTHVRSTHDSGAFARAKARGSGGVRPANGETVPGLAQAAMDVVREARVKVFPPRYAKSYLDWLGEKRDWCISRQLWWGHRIPIWQARLAGGGGPMSSSQIRQWQAEKTAALQGALDDLAAVAQSEGDFKVALQRELPASICFICTLTDDANGELARIAEGLQQNVPVPDEDPSPATGRARILRTKVMTLLSELREEPDVLDTWFSSALWPFSTLGWPEQTDHLEQYYPGSVLCTSRDIITNWVARMVMFGLYAMGEVPFDHVYIHPKILDGRGETMSKSKGNGVDPVDIIHTHGADALRYTMADMTTETQDIRMPVEYECPHCGKLTEQQAAIKAEEQARRSRGEKLTRKLQPSDCHRVRCTDGECGREFATQWADASLKGELGVARDTSDKFDIGRNFCNKLWNAARYALMNLEGAPLDKLDVAALPPEDRWILARLSSTIRGYHECIRHYQFSASVKELRDFFWDSLCDWYIELTKPRLGTRPRTSVRADSQDRTDALSRRPRSVPANRAVPSSSHRTGPTAGRAGGNERDPAKQVLAFCLDQILRLWHPTIPFITERLWQHLDAVAPQRGLPGIADVKCDSDLIVADFPPVAGYASFDDNEILKTFAELQEVTRGVRELRTQCNVPPKDRVTVTVVASAGRGEAFEKLGHIVRHMAGIGSLRISTDARRPRNAASAAVGVLRIYVHDVSDDEAERARTTEALKEIEKKIEGKESKLGNERFVTRAKPEIVEAERARLQDLIAQRDHLRAHLAELGEN